MKKISVFLLICMLVLISICPIKAAGSQELHWYCGHSKNHLQLPTPPEFSFIGDFGGYHIDRIHNDQNPEKVVYFTFDAGYENGNVSKILDVLKEKNVPGAFFVLKYFVEKNSDLIMRMTEEGHLICNHTANHKNLAKASKEKIREEIQRLEQAVFDLTGSPCAPYFRPPEGSFSEEMLKEVNALGYNTVFWSLAYEDWKEDAQPNHESAMKRILSDMHNGAVILLHPTSSTNAAIMSQLIDVLRADGYRFGNLEELCGR